MALERIVERAAYVAHMVSVDRSGVHLGGRRPQKPATCHAGDVNEA